jgi:hypothetical protein
MKLLKKIKSFKIKHPIYFWIITIILLSIFQGIIFTFLLPIIGLIIFLLFLFLNKIIKIFTKKPPIKAQEMKKNEKIIKEITELTKIGIDELVKDHEKKTKKLGKKISKKRNKRKYKKAVENISEIQKKKLGPGMKLQKKTKKIIEKYKKKRSEDIKKI